MSINVVAGDSDTCALKKKSTLGMLKARERCCLCGMCPDSVVDNAVCSGNWGHFAGLLDIPVQNHISSSCDA